MLEICTVNNMKNTLSSTFDVRISFDDLHFVEMSRSARAG